MMKDSSEPTKDFAYWLDLTLGGIGAVLLIRCLGDVFDWLKDHKPADRNDMLGCLAIYAVVILLAPRRFRYLFFSLVAIVAWGILGAISHLTLVGLPVIVCSALLAYVLLRWKGHLLK
jgi:hypothetical protein